LFLRKFNSSEKFSEVVLNPDKNSCGSLENVCRTGITEFNRLLETVLTHNRGKVNTFFIESQFSIIKDQVEKVASEEAQKSDRYLVLLAITGSTCPLLGLLGTVWGIMRAFAEIGLRGSASLSVVAPGIAEALITTIWGIAVAIPAIIAYNYFANKSRNFEDETFNFSALLLNKVKIDFFELVYKREESGDS
jgi:biopolymer transport protein TolQ